MILKFSIPCYVTQFLGCRLLGVGCFGTPEIKGLHEQFAQQQLRRSEQHTSIMRSLVYTGASPVSHFSLSIYTYIHTHVYTYIRIHTKMDMCIHIYTYMNMHMHTHIHRHIHHTYNIHVASAEEQHGSGRPAI